LVVVAFIILVVGILLDGLRKVRQETTRVAYMTIPALPRVARRTVLAAVTERKPTLAPFDAAAGDHSLKPFASQVAERSSERA
jgi:hypothetical protein